MNALFSCVAEIVAALKKRILHIVIFSLILFFGIACGILFLKPAAVRAYYETYCKTYVDKVFTASTFKVSFHRLFSSLLLFLLLLPLFITPYYSPIAVIVLFLKGFAFGAISLILFTSYGVGGFFIWLLCALPVALLSFCFSIVICAAAPAFAKDSCGFLAVKEKIFKYCPLFLFCAFLCAAAETICVILIFRPVSKIF